MDVGTHHSAKYLDDYKTHLIRYRKASGHKLSDTTIESYLRIVRRVGFSKEDSDDTVVEICNKVMNVCYNYTAFYAVRSYMIFCGKKHLVDKLIKPRMSQLTEQQLRSKVLKVSQIHAIMGYDKYPELELVIRIFYDTGMRRNALKFLVDDIDEEHNRIDIKEKEQESRLVDIHPTTMKMLMKYVKGKKPTDRAFPMCTHTIYHHLREASMKTIGKPVHLHQLRHTVITHLLENGADWVEASIFAGHKNPNTTKRYAHISGTMRHKVFAKHKELSGGIEDGNTSRL